MRKILCSFQQGQLGPDRILELELALRECYAHHFRADDELLVVWCEVPRGQGYTEGRLSDVSWLMVEVENGLEASRRENAMLAMAAAWARVAQVQVEQVLITLSDESVFTAYLAANRGRLRPLSRPWYLIRTLAAVWWSRRRDGYASIPANL